MVMTTTEHQRGAAAPSAAFNVVVSIVFVRMLGP
jgi:hypothetical protein